MKNLLKEAYDSESFRKTGHELVDLLADYLRKNLNEPNEKVMNWLEPDQQLDFWNNYLGKNKGSTDFFSDIIQHSIHLHNRGTAGPVPFRSRLAKLSLSELLEIRE